MLRCTSSRKVKASGGDRPARGGPVLDLAGTLCFKQFKLGCFRCGILVTEVLSAIDNVFLKMYTTEGPLR